MRVCMLAYTNYESDNRVMRYAEALAVRGDHVDVISIYKKGQVRYERINGVNVYRIQRRVINERMRFSYLIKILVFLINSATHLTWRHIKDRYDVIHVHSVPDFLVFAALIPKLMGAKCILDIHDLLPEFYAAKFGADKRSMQFRVVLKLEKISIAFADHVIAANDLWGEKLRVRSVRKEKCSVFLNYPDQAIFGRREKRSGKRKFTMVYPGSLIWHQGVDLAIKALAIIKDEAPEAELHIYGGGGEKDRLVRMSRVLGLEERIKIRGIKPLSEIAGIMAAADLGIVPKRSDSFGNEAFSTKILEFMSLGVPVIAADTMIDRFYFKDSVIQFFESGNENDLAKNMLTLMRDEQLRERLARNAMDYAEQFRWAKHTQRYLDLVDSLGTQT